LFALDQQNVAIYVAIIMDSATRLTALTAAASRRKQIIDTNKLNANKTANREVENPSIEKSMIKAADSSVLDFVRKTFLNKRGGCSRKANTE